MNIIPKLQSGGSTASLFTVYTPLQTPKVQAPQNVSTSNKESISIKSSSKSDTEKEDKGKLTEKDLFAMIKDINGLPNEMKTIISDLK